VPVGPPTLKPNARQFLEAPGRLAVITTLGLDGAPHHAVIWYRLAGDRFVINSKVGRRWPTELRVDPRIALVVHDGQEYVSVTGRAHVLAEGAAALRDIQELARLYDDDPREFEGQNRISFSIEFDVVGVHGDLADGA
jgi:PPOX class probable F420-dependent enzyme